MIRQALPAGLAYFAIVFAVGIAMGTVRELAIRPHAGELASVAIEAPVILLASYLVARWLVRRFAIATIFARLLMGEVAFALLIVAALAGWVWLRGQSPADWVTHLGTPAGLLSLVLFAAFAAMPVLAGRAGTRRAGTGRSGV